MKKIIYRIILILFLIIFSLITYLSLIGIETNKFNNQIEKKIKNFSKDIEIELKEIKLILDPLNFQFNSKTLGPKIKSGNQVLDLESIQTQVSLFSIFKDSFPLKNLDISTKTIEVRKLISFIRSINRDPKLLVLENFIKQGYLIADIKLEFDLNGKIKKNYEIKGFVKNGKIDSGKLESEHTISEGSFYPDRTHQLHGRARLLLKKVSEIPDWKEYYGDWKYGSKHGYGKQTFNNKNIYEGYWKKNKMHGFGFLFSKEEKLPSKEIIISTKIGIWNEGKEFIIYERFIDKNLPSNHRS